MDAYVAALPGVHQRLAARPGGVEVVDAKISSSQVPRIWSANLVWQESRPSCPTLANLLNIQELFQHMPLRACHGSAVLTGPPR